MTILFITRDAARRMWYRLMDAVDPAVIDEIEHAVKHESRVRAVENTRARWIGNQIHVELTIILPADLSFAEADHVRFHVEDSLKHHIHHLGLLYIETRAEGNAAAEHHDHDASVVTSG